MDDLEGPPSPLAAAAIRTVLQIALVWSLSEAQQQQLLGVNPAQFSDWRSCCLTDQQPSVPLQTLERIGAVFGIYRALFTLFGSDERGSAWLRRPNRAAAFRGNSALAMMLGADPQGLFSVLRYLRAETYR